MASKSSTATRDKAKSEVVAPKRDPTVKERQAIEAAQVRQKGRIARSAVAIKREGTAVTIDTPHADLAGWSDALLDTMGTNSHDFAQIALAQVMEVMDPVSRSPEGLQRGFGGHGGDCTVQ